MWLQHSSLTNANRQLNCVLPRNDHSALILSTLALLVLREEENRSPTTSSSELIHRKPTGPRYHSALWVVPHYFSGCWPREIQTENCLSPPNSHRHIRKWVRQASGAMLKVSCRGCIWRKEGVGTAMTEGRCAIRSGVWRCDLNLVYNISRSYWHRLSATKPLPTTSEVSTFNVEQRR